MSEPAADTDTVPRSRARRVLRRSWRIATFPFRVIYRTLKVLAALMALIVLLAAGTAYYFLHDADTKLRDVVALTNPAKARLPQPIRIYSADGKLLGSTATQQRIVVTGSDIPKVMNDAIVSIEDQRFYQHHGVDWQAIARAAWVNFRSKRTLQGASTITQQYVRNVYLNFEKTSSRKIKEMSLALQLEGIWSKQRILTAYLNTVYFANGRYGVEAASRYYFGHPAKELAPQEAALLAGIVQDPVSYDPVAHRQAATARRDEVLDEMFQQGYLTRVQVLKAKEHRVKLRRPAPDESDQTGDRQLTQFVLRELKGVVSPVDQARGGLRVITSLNLSDVRKVRKTLRSAYKGVQGQRPLIAASFVDPRNGRIAVVASSKDNRSFNAAVDARRQPGSTVKAFTSATLLTEGHSLSDPADNSPLKVRNGASSYTLVPTAAAPTIQDALRYSQNPAFWRLYQEAGPSKVLALERRLGLTDMDANPAAALGGTRLGTSTLQMASAYGTFANDGVRVAPHAIVEVTDLLGNKLYSDSTTAKTAVLAAEYARQTTAGLRRVVNDGFPALRQSITVAGQREVAGKTGTTNDNVDAWFVGYTPQLSGAVWTGYESSRRPLLDSAGQAVQGASVPARTWNAAARELLGDTPVMKFAKPARVQQVPEINGTTLIDAESNLRDFGFTSVTTQSKFDASKTPGSVLAVSPQPGSWISPSTPVAITYADNTKEMPNFVGRSYLDFVRQEGAFFDFTVKLAQSAQATGTILSQSVAAGQMTAKDAAVTIVVATQQAPPKIVQVPYVPTSSELAQLRAKLNAAKAKTRIVIPDVSGLSTDQATTVLQSLGLTPAVIGVGDVEATDPPAGDSAQPQTVVTVYGS